MLNRAGAKRWKEPAAKRVFDLMAVLLSSPLWAIALLGGSLLILATSGPPVFYRSRRRVYRDQQATVWKFRAMVRNAERVANRETVPIQDQAFLNIPSCSPLYTRVGRLLERLSLTEIPQVFHVLSGRMSLVGNRPLPENVIAALKARHPEVEERFASRAGMCGPVQLAGRDRISDGDRLRIEIAYCRHCLESYSWLVDLRILAGTVLRCLRLRRPLPVGEIEAMLLPPQVKKAGRVGRDAAR